MGTPPKTPKIAKNGQKSAIFSRFSANIAKIAGFLSKYVRNNLKVDKITDIFHPVRNFSDEKYAY